MDLHKGQETIEASFRESLKDVVAITEKLQLHCKTTEDLLHIAKMALDSDAQLRLLISLTMTAVPKR